MGAKFQVGATIGSSSRLQERSETLNRLLEECAQPASVALLYHSLIFFYHNFDMQV